MGTVHIYDHEARELIWPAPEVLDYEDFRSYQRWMSDTMVRQSCLMGADMGLGKTAASLHAICRFKDKGALRGCLVVAPLKVARQTWPDEMAKWSFARPMSYSICLGNADERWKGLDHPADIHIINIENFVWLYEELGDKGFRQRWNVILFDEASKLKRGVDYTKTASQARDVGVSQRLTNFGVLKRLRASKACQRVILLSGTPSTEGLVDLYGPVFPIDLGKRLGKSITAFRNRWFARDEYYRYTPLPGAFDDIMGRIKDVFFSLSSEDYLDLPELINVVHRVDLPPKALQAYRQMERDAATALVNAKGNVEEIEAPNRAVVVNKLLQICNGGIYTNEKWCDIEKEWQERDIRLLHKVKIDALKDIIERADGKPVLVAYMFQFDRTQILEAFPEAVEYQGDDEMRAWNAGKIPILLTHPASAGHGLNFQYGSNIAVWFGVPWSLELYQQFVKRLHRSGQKAASVLIHHIISNQTVEYRTMASLQRKAVTQGDIIEAVAVRLRMAA